MTQRELIHTTQVYKSASHLSQAARWGDLVWTGATSPSEMAEDLGKLLEEA